MNDYIKTLVQEFEKQANAKIAAGQAAYMRNQFSFLGLKTPIRRSIQKPFLQKNALPKKTELKPIIKYLWNKDEREYQYFAQELAQKFNKYFEKEDIELFEYMITHKSWWDTVDIIAVKLVGEYFKKFPEKIGQYTKKWIDSKNIWLQRTAILFQLQYKNDLNTQLLSSIINRLKNTDEFFLNKAIGWILRQYAKTNPQWVIVFVKNTKLNKLSKREALRNIA